MNLSQHQGNACSKSTSSVIGCYHVAFSVTLPTNTQQAGLTSTVQHSQLALKKPTALSQIRVGQGRPCKVRNCPQYLTLRANVNYAIHYSALNQYSTLL